MDKIKPNYYNRNGLECFDAIQASMTEKEYLGFLKGNVMKYLWRYDMKNGIEDLKKAQLYLEKLIHLLNLDITESELELLLNC